MVDVIEKRVENLEKELEAIKKAISDNPKKDWRAWVGTSKDDPGFDEMIRLGQEYRKTQKNDRDTDAHS